MPNFDDFDLWDDTSPGFDRERLDAEWVTLNAIREMLGIALKGRLQPTYDQSLAFGKVLAPKIFSSDASIIGKGNESQLAQEYRQAAEAQSAIDKRIVPPLELIDVDIDRFNNLLSNAGEKYDLIKRRLNILQNVRLQFLPKSYTENQLILRDLFKVQRDIPIPPIEGDTYREFQLTEDRGLRLRLLHPDPPEHLVGADLIYETYWDKKKVARLALVQYKIWDGETLLTSQAKNLKKQLAKLSSIFCEVGLCEPYKDSARLDAYRLPSCTAFLRPTDKLQDPDSRLISSGLHIPICVTSRSWENTGYEGDGEKIERKRIRSESISHKVFEEMFNTNMLGSRWFTYNEIEQLYRDHKILQPNERIVLHAQEFGVSE